MGRELKQQLVNQLQKQLQESKILVIVDYRGLNVDKVTQLRRKLRQASVDFQVVKNTLIQRAADKSNLDCLHPFFRGPTAVAFCYDEALAGISVLNSFAAENPVLEIKGGLIAGRVLAKEEVSYLATLPSKEVLLAQLIRGFQSPIYRFLSVLQGPLKKLLLTLTAIKQHKMGEKGGN